MKTLQQYIKADESSLISLSEKLIITNKINDAELRFVNQFNKYFEDDSLIKWHHVKNLIYVGGLGLCKDEDGFIINDLFGQKPVNFVWCGFNTGSSTKSPQIKLYYDIIKFISKNKDFPLIRKNIFDDEDGYAYNVYIFETEEYKICIYGYVDIYAKYTGKIVFQNKN